MFLSSTLRLTVDEMATLKPGAYILIDRVNEVNAAIADLASHRVMVGFPESTGDRRPEDGKPSPIENTDLAYIHDNGVPEAGIPQREFMRPGIERCQPQLNQWFMVAGKAALKGERFKMIDAFNGAGLTAVSSIRAKIEQGPFTPLKQSTIRARKREHPSRVGDSSANTKPLQDTGQLRNAVTYVIRKPTTFK